MMPFEQRRFDQMSKAEAEGHALQPIRRQPPETVTRLWDKDFNLIGFYEGKPENLFNQMSVTVDNADGTRQAARINTVSFVWV